MTVLKPTSAPGSQNYYAELEAYAAKMEKDLQLTIKAHVAAGWAAVAFWTGFGIHWMLSL